LIIYQANKTQFLDHAFRDDIEDIVSKHYGEATGRAVSQSELGAWKNSLIEMAKVLQDHEIPSDVGIAIEYQVPQSSKRIDFIIAGEDDRRRSNVIIVELKQWSDSRRSEKDALIWARRGGPTGEREGAHPCYQAWSYAALLRDFNTAVQEGDIDLRPCAYLHNHPRNGEIDHSHYQDHIAQAPLFLKKERGKLQDFIRSHVKYGDSRKALYAIENGRIKPSKILADSVKGMLQGRTEFLMIDDQKVVYETALAAGHDSEHQKQVVIVQGGPGTGKSVVALNLLAKFIERRRNARYVSKNAAPREVYEAKLAGTFKKSRISNLFSGSGEFHKCKPDTYDVLVIDEAHRLNAKSGIFRNLGENQIREIIRASRCAVFFVDDDQRVTIHDIGHSEEIRRLAHEQHAVVTERELSSQFRCNGSDGYLAWLDDTLDIRHTANNLLDTSEYDFRVFDSPTEMHALIETKNRINNRSRVVAGYCWEWPSKKNPTPYDIELQEFGYRKRWNLAKDGSLWIVAPNSVDEIGCVHTCQGLELDYVGILIGPDLTYRDGKVVADASKRASSDQTVKGLKKMRRSNPAEAHRLGDLIVKNTYRTLMTRGMKGCFVYCTDPGLAEYLRSRIYDTGTESRPEARSQHSPADSFIDHQFRRVTKPDRLAGHSALPVIDLRRSVDNLRDESSIAAAAIDWIAPPDWVTPRAGMFVAQATDGPLTPRVPEGTWCLFRLSAGYAVSSVSDVPRAERTKQMAATQDLSVSRNEMVADNDRDSRHAGIEFLAELHRSL
jgi:DUF2075 family protein